GVLDEAGKDGHRHAESIGRLRNWLAHSVVRRRVGRVAFKDMHAAEIRRRFLDYFARQQHIVRPSSSLVPADDPTLLFTNAGMVQFKKVFLGLEQPPEGNRRATTSQ